CKNLLQNLKKHQAAWLFLEPVDPVVACAPDYYEVIKHPMDLSTVEKRLMAEEYEGPQQFVDDIQLMLNNCFVYNPPTNGVHISGKDLEAFFLRQLNKCFPAITTNSIATSSKPKAQKATARGKSSRTSSLRTSVQSITEDQKRELSELITRVPDEHMDKVLNIIRSGLPQLDETEGEIELDVETIDAVTLVELYSFV
ncbi:Bromodomain-containing protein, partial [Gaertneriomyces semiglobifer]